MTGLLFLVLIAACACAPCAATVGNQEVGIKGSICDQLQSAQNGDVAAPKTCALSEVPGGSEGEFQCLDVEVSPVQCGPDSLYREGSLCVHRLDNHLALHCRDGHWTRTDDLQPVRLQKRFLGVIGAIVGIVSGIATTVGVICDIFCEKEGGGGGGPPPNRPPSITCPGSQTVTAAVGHTTATVTWTPPSASDPDGGKPAIRQRGGPQSGSQFQEGNTYVSFEARDSGGLTDTCYFQVTVTVPTCPQLTTPRYGLRPSCSGASRSNIHGSTCTFSCYDGYDLQGQRSLTCQPSGTWSHPEPQCKAKSCGDPGGVTGGIVVCPGGTTYRQVCSITCYTGYRHSASPFTLCGASGGWSPPVQGCQDSTPPTFTSGCPPDRQHFSGPLGTAVTLTWPDPVTTDNSGGVVTLTSSPASGSSFLPGWHRIRITARDPAGNAASCSFAVNVQVRRCQMLSVPDGRVSCSHGYLEGSVCNVSCNHGYRIQGQPSLTCSNTETWTPALPTCTAVTCPTVPSVQAGGVTCPVGSSLHALCLLTCDPGHTAQPPRFASCTAHGNWTQPGACLDTEAPVFQNGCPDNVEVFAARLGQNTTADWTAPVVSDNSGETIVPTSDVPSGASFPVGVTYVTYTARDSSGNGNTCRFSVTVTTLSCEQPDFEDPARGRSLMLYDCPDRYLHGAVCTVSCTNGYPQQGATTVTCERDDSQNPPRMFWAYNGTQPACIESNCPRPDDPENGALSCLLGNHGWDCFMQCNDNWDIVASFDGRFVCTNSDGFWRPSVVPDCQVAYLPSRAKLPSELYYFTNSCQVAVNEIRTNFIAALSNSTWRDACVNVPTCTASNVQVFCGPVSGRRRRSTDTELLTDHVTLDRRRRQTQLALTIAFTMNMDFVMNGTSENTLQLYKAKEQEVWSALKRDAESGVFDLGSLVPDARYTGYPTLQFDCPSGTKFQERTAYVASNKASCVGCSKGSYLSASSGDCVQCEKGQYTELDTATSCTPCPAGQSTLSQGADNRTLCLDQCTAGHFSPTGLAPCQPCPPGSYQSRDQALTCDLCPSGTWTALAASVSTDNCSAADVHLTTNVTLNGTMTSSNNSVTVTTWLKLESNSSVVISIAFNNDTQNPLRILTHTENAGDVSPLWNSQFSQPPTSTVEVAQGQWERVVVTVTNGLEVTVFQNNTRVVTFNLSRALTSVTGDVETLVLRGKGVISGLRAEARATTQGEVTQSFGSCTGDYSSNIATWTPRPSSVHLPSTCDAVDECQSSPCSSHGVCHNRVDGFQCQCQDGWTGGSCEMPPDACHQHQCQNGARCVVTGDNYTCTCAQQFAGDRCQFTKVHGEWGDWAAWSQCSATCAGTQQRQRSCNNPSPLHGGSDCTGQDKETRDCGEPLCAVDGGWGTWTDWTSCSATCGGGETTRSRQCNNPRPQNGGAPCVGESRGEKSCGTGLCPVHGGFSDWSRWSSCSVTCGNGMQSRERSCDNPVPANGGDPCSGPTNQTRLCNLVSCPECQTLPTPEGTGFNCSHTVDPVGLRCRLVCEFGYSTPTRDLQLTCGRETDYLWNFERNNTVYNNYNIPHCTRMKTGQTATAITTVPYSNTDCSQRAAIANEVSQNLQQLPCVRDSVCTLDVTGECVTADVNKGSGRRRRSVDHTAVKVNMTADFGGSVTFDPNDNSSIADYVKKLSSIDQSASMVAVNDTMTLFTVTLNNGVINPDVTEASYSAFISCPPGMMSYDGGCVECPAGFYEESGQCVLCPLGHYQDLTTSTSCKPCPDDLSWDVMGATDVTQCIYPAPATDNSNTNDPTAVASSDEDTMKLIVGVVVGVIGAVGIGAAIAVYVVKTKIAKKVGDNPLWVEKAAVYAENRALDDVALSSVTHSFAPVSHTHGPIHSY